MRALATCFACPLYKKKSSLLPCSHTTEPSHQLSPAHFAKITNERVVLLAYLLASIFISSQFAVRKLVVALTPTSLHCAEITNEHVVPLGYLLTLILLFMLIVLDRVVYTLGSPLGKALLHVRQGIISTLQLQTYAESRLCLPRCR